VHLLLRVLEQVFIDFTRFFFLHLFLSTLDLTRFRRIEEEKIITKSIPFLIEVSIEVSPRITSCGDIDNFYQECILAQEHRNVRDISHTWKVGSSTEIMDEKNEGQDERLTRHPSPPKLGQVQQVGGGLLLGHTEPNRFIEDDETLLVGLAAQAAVALENARLYRTMQMRVQELNAIFESIADGVTLPTRCATR
jgi:hypothetical protein